MKTILSHATSLLALLIAAVTRSSSASTSGVCRVYFGTLAKQEECGIYMAILDMQTGQLGQPLRVSHAPGAGFLAIHPDGNHIYSTGGNNVFDGIKTGSVKAFRIVEPDGTLAEINTRPSGGLHPCHVSIDPTGKNLLAANYVGGSCAVFPIQPDGALASASSIRKHHGSSVNPQRQTAAFTHFIQCDPSGTFAFAVDLGMDKIMLYRFDAATGTLTPNTPPFIATEPGGGPRHLAFLPSGAFAYVSLELTSKVVAFQVDAKRGTLTELQSLSSLPAGFSGENTTSEIQTTPDGHFLYVGNRGHNSLAIFSIDATSGKLTLIGHESTRGDIPRHFGMDPTGTFLIAANATSGNAVVFRIDRDSGRLTYTGSEIKIPAPTCVRFLTAP